MTITNKRSLIALLLSVVLVVSLFTVGISATEVASTNEEVTTTVENDSVASEAASEKETEKETETSAPTTGTEEDAAAAEAIKAKKTTLIINACIIAAIIVIGVVLCFKFRKKLGEFLRSVKSEFKKITWTSKEQTLRGFIVVLVIAVIFAVVLTLMDLAFNTSISSLRNLFH